MDPWKFYDITHRDHVVCNPTSVARLDELVGLLDVRRGERVLDVACGKGELLLRLAEHAGGPRGAGFSAVGIDVSPYCVADLRTAAERRAPDASIEIVEGDGAAYRPESGAFDLACCLGASWIFGGHAGTLRAMAPAVRPGGQVLVGEPFWIGEPVEAYLEVTGLSRDSFGSHADNVRCGIDEGLTPTLALVSSGEDWDRYESLQWRATARYAASHPEDLDVPELVARVSRERDAYLSHGRTTLGWALYLFRVEG